MHSLKRVVRSVYNININIRIPHEKGVINIHCNYRMSFGRFLDFDQK